MPSLTKWKVVSPGRSQGSRFSCVTTKTGVWNGAFSGHACAPASNMRLPFTLDLVHLLDRPLATFEPFVRDRPDDDRYLRAPENTGLTNSKVISRAMKL